MAANSEIKASQNTHHHRQWKTCWPKEIYAIYFSNWKKCKTYSAQRLKHNPAGGKQTHTRDQESEENTDYCSLRAKQTDETSPIYIQNWKH